LQISNVAFSAYFTLATSMTEQPSDRCYPQIFFDSLVKKGKSGDKGEAYASDVAFLQKAFSHASSGYFCPLRFGVKLRFNL